MLLFAEFFEFSVLLGHAARSELCVRSSVAVFTVFELKLGVFA